MADHAPATLGMKRPQTLSLGMRRIIDEGGVLHGQHQFLCAHALDAGGHVRGQYLFVGDVGIVKEAVGAFKRCAIFQCLRQRGLGPLAQLARQLNESRITPRVSQVRRAKFGHCPVLRVGYVAQAISS